MTTPLHRTCLIVGALMGMGAFFLPYLSLNYTAGEFSVSGLKYVQMILEKFMDLGAGKEDIALSGTISAVFYEIGIKPLISASAFSTKLAAVGFFAVLLGPFYFFLFSLGYLWRGIMGKQYQRGIIFNILFLVASWAVFYFLGKETKVFSINFFWYADFGYWLAFIGMFVAAFSDFFWKEK
jgi:hypothetical protein